MFAWPISKQTMYFRFKTVLRNLALNTDPAGGLLACTMDFGSVAEISDSAPWASARISPP